MDIEIEIVLNTDLNGTDQPYQNCQVVVSKHLEVDHRFIFDSVRKEGFVVINKLLICQIAENLHSTMSPNRELWP